MPAWLIFIRSEEDDPFGPRPSTISWRNHQFWDLPSYLLLLGRIPISKWGLRPNIRVQAFAPTITHLIMNCWSFSFLSFTQIHIILFFLIQIIIIIYLFLRILFYFFFRRNIMTLMTYSFVSFATFRIYTS